LIHDQFFDIDGVAFDASTVTIPFTYEDRDREEVVERQGRRRRLARVPLLRAQLTLQNAIEFELADHQRVGTYDFNELRFDGRRVVVDTNIPLTLEVIISALDIRVIVYDEIVGSQLVRYGFGGSELRSGAGRHMRT
jgi:hypothetical protein